MYSTLLKKIKEYDKITILRHINPDGDAMFSAMAVYTWLKDNFKEKTVKVGGYDDYDIMTKKDKISDRYLKESLCIIVDTSNVKRIDEPRYGFAPYIIKIDHHPIVDQYGDLNIVDTTAAACCEVLTGIFLSPAFKKYVLSPKTCEYLYCGIVTDTCNFSTTNTSPKTLELSAKIAEKGNLEISRLFSYLMDKDIKSFQKLTKIRNYLKIVDKFGYILLYQKDLKEIDMEARDAKNNIDEINRISDINVWAFAVEEEDGSYAVSVRSKQGYVINTICAGYGGGGHANASGVKGLTKASLIRLINDLVEVSTN